ncbi:hypothetical protein LTR62_000578 [Meristemomyces frigidus]|uniref:Zn(2)-C6 fungal-type domain-containing protein n=1 Tax=Meristemomyces frigidus TaxID=1508187 RepID=A0AAN7YMU7_9PEZI|nr:hypothetical protein LTR62_000578 [Meristemomyces frigidus]
MRSSIACIRCRRSKVKCVNNGVGSTCRSCDNAGRECIYPSPVTTATSRRRDSLPVKQQDGTGDRERRPKARKSAHTFVAGSAVGNAAAARDSVRPLLDALDPRVLTPLVWQELYDIFMLHYSSDLPFLHSPTFLKPLRHATMQPPANSGEASAASSRPPASQEFLLAFLALTARFHPGLVAHHSPPTPNRPSSPLRASEYYASAAHERLSTSWTDNQFHDIERIQAALMIGLHEWSMCRGAKAWLTIGIAIRAAQAMGLQYERDLDDEPMSRALALGSEAERMGLDGGRKSAAATIQGDENGFVRQEIRRRTFWSCYVMDRYLSSGKYRPQMLHAPELRIQLPASERAFMFGENVRTLMLGEEEKAMGHRAESQGHRHNDSSLGRDREPENSRIEVGMAEGMGSRYIRILELYGRVVQWSCSGGRRLETQPPWDERCQWHKLRQQCLDFKASLPRHDTLSAQNTQAHISMKTSTSYTLVHTVYLLCKIMLHREYVPFLPIRCDRPVGPLDAPMFPADEYQVPAGFWESSAVELFKAARDTMDLLRSCQEWNALVQTPIVGFAVYTVAFVGLYSISFPWMDPDGYMCTPPSARLAAHSVGRVRHGDSGFMAARRALEMLGQMRPRLCMAEGWLSTIIRMHKYFRRMKADYRKNTSSGSSASGDDSGSTVAKGLREGGSGGGLEEWKLLERTIKDFGNLEDHDIEIEDGNDAHGSRGGDALYDDSSAGTTVKSEDRDARHVAEHSKADGGGPWNAINATSRASASTQPNVATPNSAQFRSYDSNPSRYQTSELRQQLQPSSQGQPPYTSLENSFRPASPASQAASTPSQASQPFDRPPAYAAWTPQNTGYPPMQHNQQTTYQSNLLTHAVHPQGLSNVLNNPYAPPPPPGIQNGQQQQQHQLPMQQSALWDAHQKEAWLDGLPTTMYPDDLAAFGNGEDIGAWASREHYGNGPVWLNTIWGGVNGSSI